MILGQAFLPQLETRGGSSFWVFSPGFPYRNLSFNMQNSEGSRPLGRVDLLLLLHAVSPGVLSSVKPPLTPVFHHSQVVLCFHSLT